MNNGLLKREFSQFKNFILGNLGCDAFPKYFSLLLFLEEKVVFCQPGFAVPTPHCRENNSWHVLGIRPDAFCVLSDFPVLQIVG